MMMIMNEYILTCYLKKGMVLKRRFSMMNIWSMINTILLMNYVPRKQEVVVKELSTGKLDG